MKLKYTYGSGYTGVTHRSELIKPKGQITSFAHHFCGLLSFSTYLFPYCSQDHCRLDTVIVIFLGGETEELSQTLE